MNVQNNNVILQAFCSSNPQTPILASDFSPLWFYFSLLLSTSCLQGLAWFGFQLCEFLWSVLFLLLHFCVLICCFCCCQVQNACCFGRSGSGGFGNKQVCAVVAASLRCRPTWIHHIWRIQVIPHEYECSGVSEQLWQKKKKGKSSMLVSYLAFSRWHTCYFFLDLLRIGRVWILYCCVYYVQKAQKLFPKFFTCILDTVGSIEIRMC